jgi:hypothetical protein
MPSAYGWDLDLDGLMCRVRPTSEPEFVAQEGVSPLDSDLASFQAH